MIEALPQRYRLILCDLWGVVHDGYRLYPGAAERLLQWREEGRGVVLVTNAPRTSEAIEAQLVRLGLPREAWSGIATGGDAGIAALKAIGQPVGFIGTPDDRLILEGAGLRIASGDEFAELACTGVSDFEHTPEHYREQLKLLARLGVRMHCLNPDRVVIHGGKIVYCAGALADIYVALGGRVEWYGKPFRAIYDFALSLVGNPPASEVLAVGDGLQTDILGAARMGFDAIFVTGGIHAGEPFPHDFAAENGLGDWRPIAVVGSLG
ncbi:MAG TPA: TIGR01459 family HAD-type hydrolase [Sphingomicrobium sp.]